MQKLLMMLTIVGLTFAVPVALSPADAWATGGHHNGDKGDDDGDDNGSGDDDGDNGDGEGNGKGDDGDNGDNGDTPSPDPGPSPEAAAEPAGDRENRVVDQEGATTNDRDDLLRFLKNGANTLVRITTSPPCFIEQVLSFGDSAETCLVLAVFDTTQEE